MLRTERRTKPGRFPSLLRLSYDTLTACPEPLSELRLSPDRFPIPHASLKQKAHCSEEAFPCIFEY